MYKQSHQTIVGERNITLLINGEGMTGEVTLTRLHPYITRNKKWNNKTREKSVATGGHSTSSPFKALRAK